jgi:hypothetical protein
LEAEDLGEYRVAADKLAGNGEADWNANYRDIKMLEYNQSCAPWSWMRILKVDDSTS